MNKSKAFLRCIEADCHSTFEVLQRLYTCPACGGLLDVAYEFNLPAVAELKALFKLRKISDDEIDKSGVWRFLELMPFTTAVANIVTIAEGNTPLYSAPRS